MPGARQRSATIDLSLAGYGWAAHMAGDPLTKHEAAVLTSAQAILAQARRDLPHGRGNVTTDLAAGAGEAGYRTQWARRNRAQWAPALPEQPTREAWGRWYGQSAAVNTVAGAGHCGEHGVVSLGRTLDAVEPDDLVLLVVNREADHTWVEVDRMTDQGPVGATIDAWADGPAVRARDGAFSKWTGQDGGPEVTQFVATDAPHVRSGRDQALARMASELDLPRSMSDLRAAADAAGWTPKGHYAPTPVINPDLMASARAGHQQLTADGDPWRSLFSEAAAVAADRTLGTPLREAAHRAPAVVAAGLQLDQPSVTRHVPPGLAVPAAPSSPATPASPPDTTST